MCDYCDNYSPAHTAFFNKNVIFPNYCPACGKKIRDNDSPRQYMFVPESDYYCGDIISIETFETIDEVVEHVINDLNLSGEIEDSDFDLTGTIFEINDSKQCCISLKHETRVTLKY